MDHFGRMTLESPDVREIYDRYASQLALCRDEVLTSLQSAPYSDVLSAFFQRGKMVRSLLVFIASSAVGGKAESVVSAAGALELLHGASLIHDDIIDGSRERRGQPAIHRLLGPAAALVVGDYLLLQALHLVSRTAAHQSPDRVLRAMESLNTLARQCCQGQIDELSGCSIANEESRYLEIVRQKTGTQFAAATAVGAILGGGTDAEIAALSNYGLSLGAGFQIQDDILDDVEASPSLTGGFDRMASLERYDLAAVKGTFNSGMESSGDDDGSPRGRLRALQEFCAAEAIASLAVLPPGPDIASLRLLCQFAIHRHS